jgi:hypothetical protein
MPLASKFSCLFKTNQILIGNQQPGAECIGHANHPCHLNWLYGTYSMLINELSCPFENGMLTLLKHFELA